MKRHAVSLCLALSTMWAAPAMAESETCNLYQEVDKYQLLRRLSLDLRHQLPTYEEYRALDDGDTVSASVIEDYLASETFTLVARRYHAKLLWPNLDGVQLPSTQYILRTGLGGVYYLNNQGRSKAYRGGPILHACQNKPQTDIQPGYVTGQTPQCETVEDGGATYCLEGYVNVHAYWQSNPNATVKLCAFEAQVAESAPMPGKGLVECNDNLTEQAKGCGCGPNANYCWGPRESTTALVDEIEEQFFRTIDDHTVGGFPYSEMLTTKREHRNGRLDHFDKHLAQMALPNQTFNRWHEGDAPLVDEPDFQDTIWYVAERSGPHSGILTLPAYTLRFQTNRGRANRFRIAFTNQYFEPSNTPDTEGCSDTTNNLTERCTCRYCHSTLEPLAGHFALIAEAGSSLFNDRKLYPIDNPACVIPEGGQGPPKGGGMPFCGRFWITDSDADHPGRLITHQYYEEVPAIAAAIEAGPLALAQATIDDGSFHRATVERVFEHFIGRALNLDASDPDNETKLRDQLVTDFREHDNFVELVRAVVQLDVYRRIR